MSSVRRMTKLASVADKADYPTFHAMGSATQHTGRSERLLARIGA